MKKILLITSVLILLCVLLVSCNKLIDDENSKSAAQNEASLTDLSVPVDVSDYNVSVTEESETSNVDISSPEESNPPEDSNPEEISEAEESQTEVVESYVWYGQEEMNQWLADYYAYWDSLTGKNRTHDGKHLNHYSGLGEVNLYINEKAGTDKHNGIFENEYFVMFEGTQDCTAGAVLDYYGITKEEYIEYFNSTLPEAPEGEMPFFAPYSIYIYHYDALFAEQYWNHPFYLVSDYVPPEIDSYYTSLEDRGGYTKRYYRIDRLLIEYVGVDEFEKWLDEKEDVDQNILDFVKYFGITREIYEDIYRETCYLVDMYGAKWHRLPYNTDYLFGTPEMQDEYFKVHPLD
ncbi:MAG: hypothetical protein IKM27_01690 [Clostridia bacterium]|nr:hypothetical protein [Clostridia bacterium]